MKFSIIHTNDFHGHLQPEVSATETRGGAPWMTACQRRLEQNAVDNLVLDAGDIMLGAPPISQMVDGRSSVDYFNLRGVRAIALGNHEFDKGPDVIAQRRNQSSFKWLSANIVKSGTQWEHPDYVEPYAVFTLPHTGVRVGVIGVTTPVTPLIVLSKWVKGLEFKDPVEAIENVYPEVEAVSDFIIVLAHIGFDDYKPADVNYDGTKTIAQKLIALNISVDMIISGHDHRYAYSPYSYGQTRVVEAGCYSNDIGQLLVNFDNETRDISYDKYPYTLFFLSTKARKHVCSDLEWDNATQELVDRWYSRIKPYVERVVGVSTVSLTRDGCSGGLGECTMGNLIANGMLWFGDLKDDGKVDGSVQIAMTNFGGLRADIALDKGQTSHRIQYGELLTVVPFGNAITYITLTGAQVRDLVTAWVQNEGAAAKPLATAGLSFKYWASAGGNATVWSIEVGGQKLDLARKYRVVTTNFVAGGGDGWPLFANLPNTTETDMLDIESLTSYIENGLRGNVTAQSIPMGRAIKEPPPSTPSSSSGSSGKQPGAKSSSHAHSSSESRADTASSHVPVHTDSSHKAASGAVGLAVPLACVLAALLLLL
eukprot:m51a1_g14034 hypothetical protein (596) ;mRNA; f:1161855-1164043